VLLKSPLPAVATRLVSECFFPKVGSHSPDAGCASLFKIEIKEHRIESFAHSFGVLDL
jgi:hypothetical protein